MKEILSVCWRLYSPTAGLLWPLSRAPAPLVSIQVRGKKQQFGGATRDPFKSLQRKLVRKQQRTHAKVPLMSKEREQLTRLAPVTISSVGQLVATYTPLERFAKAPIYTRLGLSQRRKAFTESLATLYSTATIRRKLRKVDPFRPVTFAKLAQQQFVDVNTALQRNKDKRTLRDLITENALESLQKEFEHRQFVWELREQIDRPRVISAKIIPVEMDGNYFAQVVVRMHTSQILAVYSKAGELLRGHPSEPKVVIDYVVLERHLQNPERGRGWRIAGKLPPQVPWKSLLSSQDNMNRDKENSLPAA